MDKKSIELPDLLWSCFINWINTLEKTLKSDLEQDDALKNNILQNECE